MWNAYAKIFWLSLLLARSQPTSAATYEAHIRPLLDKHCVDCHRDGEAGPFRLDSYEAAASRAKLLAAVTRGRVMPPYKAKPSSLPFHNERRLTPAEIALFAAWAQAGAPRGKSIAARPERPAKPFAADLAWEMTAAVDLPAEGPDLYRCVVVPAKLAEARWISAFRFVPGNARVVHHALFFFDLSGAARKRDQETGGEGYPCFGSPGFLPASSLGGWSPGNRVLEMPGGTAVRAPKGADLVMQLHYRLTGKPETDRSRLEVRFSATPPVRRLTDIALTSNAIDIAPGVAGYRVRDRFEIPVSVTLWQIIPHAHFLARRMRAWATPPGQAKRVLLAIDDWDFNWQDIYQLRKPLPLPAGTLVEMEILYDNTTANVRNPNHPPKRVQWGLGTADEMAGMHLNVTVDDEARDLQELNAHLWGKMIRTVGIGAPKR
jgi:hypothetical protein